jgi:hypothetical protein
MTFDEILTKARELPTLQRKTLIYELVESLTQPIENPVEERIFGLTKGSFVMSEDFDDELPIEFWLGTDA